MRGLDGSAIRREGPGMPASTSYDEILYPGNPFGDTHPDHLAVLASLNGMRPAPVSRCRVLELGCGDGGNLIPMALQLPDSEFVGLDLSERSIAIGNANIAALGLRNIALASRDIMDISPADGRFDYIIAHGVYSWVPQAVRDKLLSVYSQNLAPQGVGYISYNAFPGAHLRNLARSIMHFHVRAVSDPDARVAQCRMLMKFLAEASPQDEIYGFILRDQYERIKSVPDAVFVHDDLDEGSTAFFLYQVVETAAQVGLQYLADADLTAADLAGQPEQVKVMLAGIPEEEVAAREQYLDFITGRVFRMSLFCHHDVTLQRVAGPQRLSSYYFSSTAQPAIDTDIGSVGVVEFRTDRGRRIATDHGLSKAALLLLGRAWPQAIGFADLLAQARSIAAPTAQEDEEGADEIGALQNMLLRAARSGHVQLHCEPPRLTTALSERPRASPLARLQVRQQALVTSLRHDLVTIDGEIARRFLALVDGTRDPEQLRADLADEIAGEVTHEDVMRSLNVLARLGLLLG
jgi:SAM-dependent methyltransferase